ncbi:hypothetical protein TWF481_010392 [Arthrobotrys musiformis]|uniref:Uncharacterized protein n=1 Tax=Arthrobotrys musiformis TaxID=47236 RepID=A0AAV9W0U4_9PEZI
MEQPPPPAPPRNVPSGLRREVPLRRSPTLSPGGRPPPYAQGRLATAADETTGDTTSESSDTDEESESLSETELEQNRSDTMSLPENVATFLKLGLSSGFISINSPLGHTRLKRGVLVLIKEYESLQKKVKELEGGLKDKVLEGELMDLLLKRLETTTHIRERLDAVTTEKPEVTQSRGGKLNISEVFGVMSTVAVIYATGGPTIDTVMIFATLVWLFSTLRPFA